MERKQLIALALCNLGLFTLATMVLTLLPVYAVQLGMDEGVTGIYIGVAFGTLTIGALFGGWLSNRFQRRVQTLIVVSTIAIPATFLMGQSGSLGLLILCTLIVWFAAGLGSATVSILAGMFADADQRGLVFGIMGAMLGLGQVIGGIAMGAITDRWGFEGLYAVSALVWLVPIIAALFVRDKVIERPHADQPRAFSPPLGTAFWLLLLATVLVYITNFSVGLARTFMMNDLLFDASAISSAAAVGGLVAIPLPFLIGWLSDRIGRKQLLLLCYALASVGTLILLSASSLSQFWLSVVMFSLVGGAVSVGSAFAIDLTPPQALSTALSRFAAAPFVAGVVGYGATGLIIQQFGMQTLLLLGAALPLVAIFLLVSIRQQVRVVPA